MTKYRNPLVTGSGVPKVPIHNDKAAADALYQNRQNPQTLSHKTNANNRYLSGRGWK